MYIDSDEKNRRNKTLFAPESRVDTLFSVVLKAHSRSKIIKINTFELLV